MSILTRGLEACQRPSRGLVFIGRTFSTYTCKNVDATLRFPSAAIFPPSPPEHIRVDVGASPSFFLEDSNEEYTLRRDQTPNLLRLGTTNSLAPTMTTSTSNNHAVTVLLRLLSKGDLEGALAAKTEFEKLGTEIGHHHSFADVAISSLDNPDSRARSRDFLAWWPLADLDANPGAVARACGKLMRAPFELRLLMGFCMCCAKTGHLHLVEKTRILRSVFYHGHPVATTSFLANLEAEVKRKNSIPEGPGPAARDRTGSTQHSGRWMSLRSLAIRVHLTAGRKRTAKQLYRQGLTEGIVFDAAIEAAMRTEDARFPFGFPALTANDIKAFDQSDRLRPVSTLRTELDFLRKIIKTQKHPPPFEVFLSKILLAKERIKVDAEIRELRQLAFTGGSLAARTNWIVGEMHMLSALKRPLAVFRTLWAHFELDESLLSEIRPILRVRRGSRRRSTRDWKESRILASLAAKDEKLWPTEAILQLAWENLLKVSKKRDLERLYTKFLNLAQASLAHSHTSDPLSNIGSSESSKDQTSSQLHTYTFYPPNVLPTPRQFHNFVVAFATRINPRRGAQILEDMKTMGLKPTLASWGTLAGAYARSGDLSRINILLAYLDREFGIDPNAGPTPSDPTQIVNIDDVKRKRERLGLITAYNSSLRGFIEGGFYYEARTIEERMRSHGLLVPGEFFDGYTRRALKDLRRLENGKFECRKRDMRLGVKLGDGRIVRVASSRAEWLSRERTVNA